MKLFFEKCFRYLLARVVLNLVNGIIFTCRLEKVGESRVAHYLKSGRYVFASWHGRAAIFFTSLEHGSGHAVMTSRSRDGELAATLQKAAGCVPFRGSTRKGGAEALIQMGEYMSREEKPAILSIDGPTGPIYKVKPGVVRLASRTGFPVIPVSFSAEKAVILRSWDRCMIPKPFSKATLIYGEPIFVPADLSKEELSKYIGLVEEELMRITLDADGRNNQCAKTLKTDMAEAA